MCALTLPAVQSTACSDPESSADEREASAGQVSDVPSEGRW